MPTSFVFHMRQIIGDRLKWDPISLETQELLKRAKCHSNPSVDICMVTVLDLVTAKLKSDAKYIQWVSVGKEDLPGSSKIAVAASDDIVVAGYPRSFYDQVNLYPIIKAGIIASRWGSNFNGNPYFLIDAKLFPGSSGSIVVSKPIDMVVSGGKVFTSKEKQYAFLGIYSGEPFLKEQPVELDDIIIMRKLGFNLGIVWYGYLIEEIIANGQTPRQ